MIWFARRHGNELREAANDLAVARQERQKAERLVEVNRSRWPQVFQIVSDYRKIRRVNHIADDLLTIFRGH